MLERVGNFFKKYWLELLVTILFWGISVIIIKIGYKNELTVNTTLSEFVENLFNCLISLIAIWFSAYFILIQLYKNTYPMEVIEKNFIKKIKNILIFSIYTILFGILELSGVDNILIEYYFIILFVLNLILIICNTYFVNRSLTINTYVDKYFKKISKKLKNKKLTKKNVDESFESLQRFFNDCIIKDEYSVCNNISDKMGEFFRSLIEECNSLLLNKKGDLANYIFDKIIDTSISQIRMAKSSKIPSFYKALMEQQTENMLVCVEINNSQLFEKYVYKINLLTKEHKENGSFSLEIASMNQTIAENLLDKEERWIEEFLEDLFSLNFSFSINNACNNLGILIISLMIKNDEMERENPKYSSKYDILKKYLEKYTNWITKFLEDIDKVPIYYSWYGMKILKGENEDRVKDFIDIITSEEIGKLDSEPWNAFILFYLTETMNKWEDLGATNRKKIIDYTISLNINDPVSSFSELLPDYSMIIPRNATNKDELKKILDEIEHLLMRLLYNNLEGTLKRYLIDINEIALKTENSEIVSNIVELNIKVMRRLEKEKIEIYEFLIFNFEDFIEELDKDRKINEEISKKLIDELFDMGESTSDERKIVRIISLINSILNKFDYEYFFITSKKIDKKYIWKRLYNLGTVCLENNMIDALKNISNILGWQTIHCLREHNNNEAIYILKRAEDLYRFAKTMHYSDTLLIYLLTLFTTVGIFCYKDTKYLNVSNIIINILKDEQKDMINIAIELRTKENNMWDEELYDGKTKTLTEKFEKNMFNAIDKQEEKKNKKALKN